MFKIYGLAGGRFQNEKTKKKLQRKKYFYADVLADINNDRGFIKLQI